MGIGSYYSLRAHYIRVMTDEVAQYEMINVPVNVPDDETAL